MSLSRIPSLNWLRVFEAAARTQSFVRAAELLNMSPPAVSQQIKSLETYLGRELFERGAHSVRLTPAGDAFLPSVQQALLSVESAAAGLFGTRAETTIHVQATLVLAAGWLGLYRTGGGYGSRRFRHVLHGVWRCGCVRGDRPDHRLG